MTDSKKEYTLGLDIGTNSIGWAVVDENRQLVRKGKQRLWGVRMFEESKDASARRTFRCSRRRIQRRKERIDLLRELFAGEIDKVDHNFYTRLNESFYLKDDSTIPSKDIFNNYLSNKEYYTKYPTIWHLRNELYNSDEKCDIRLLYLACHHIIKYRGNFLQDGDEFNKGDISYLVNILNDLDDTITETREFLSSEDGNDNESASDYLVSREFNEELVNQILTILNPNNKVVSINGKEVDNKKQTAKSKNLEVLLDGKGNIYKEIIIKLLVSNEVNLSKTKLANNKEDKCVLNLYSETIETDVENAASSNTDLAKIIELLPQLKYITDYVKLNVLLGEHNTLSEALVARYNEHKTDLNSLKYLIKTYQGNNKDKNGNSLYDRVFRVVGNEVNYPSYIGMNSVDGKKENFKHGKYEDFISFIKKILSEIKDNIEEKDVNLFNELSEKADNNTLLLRINGGSNGNIPHQLHLKELRTILNKQSKFYPFLLENDEKYNITVLDKIVSIFKFKRPYYVGPLKGEEFSWASLKENEIVLPWNFDQVVDLDKSGEDFITRMLNKCTYLKGENDFCLPKDSLTYTEYNVLNYLNTLKIGGVRINKEVRDELYNNLFMQTSKVTSKLIRSYFATHYNVILGKTDVPEVTCTLAPHLKFKEIFGEDFEQNRPIIEQIIRDITIFEDKKILEKRLRTIYNLDDDKVKRIKSLNYKKTARLCDNLLNRLGFNEVDPETGEYIKMFNGILSIFREYTMNFQEILFSDRFDVKARIDDYNRSQIKNNGDEDSLLKFIDENLTVSPIYIRSYIQTIRIIDELEDILKQPIDYYSIEFTRTNKAEKKKQSVSRYDDLKEKILNASKQVIDELNHINVNTKTIIDRLNNEEVKVAIQNSEAVYLYFSQLGKCMYSGEDIDLDDLLTGKNSNYDIDHIYPQSLIKDNSMSNKVLVKKSLNNIKQNKFLCDTNVLKPGINRFHKFLLENHLITKTKYTRLTEPKVNDDILQSFAARQKVATDQAVKALVTTLKLYKGVKENQIIYSKAENISDYRKQYDIVKSRTANNYHHAHDAYMNAVLGKMFDDYFRDRHYLVDYKIKDNETEEKQETTNFMKVVKYPRYRLLGNKECIWRGDIDNEIIKKNITETFDILETTRTAIGNEMLSKVTILPKNQGKVKVKNLTPNGNEYDIANYGGITSSSYAKYAIIKYQDKKKEVVKLIAIPRTYLDTDGTNNLLIKYIEEVLNISNYTIEHNCIKPNVVMEQDKREWQITGVTKDSYLIKNNKDRNFNYKSIKIIHNIDKYNKCVQEKNHKYKVLDDKIILHTSKLVGDKYYNCNIEITKDDLDYLYNKIIMLYSKDIYNFSNIINICTLFDNKIKFSILEYVKLISELLLLLKTNERKSADLTLINGSKFAGVLLISSSLQKGMKFIQYSPTGLRKKVLYEVK